MIRNYIKIAWRNIIRNKVNSIINLSGLAIGMACVILIVMYVKDELGYDQIFKDSNRIYRVNLHSKMGDDEGTYGHTPPPVGAALMNNFPEIGSYTRIMQPGDEVVHYDNGGQKVSFTEKNVLAVDSNFLKVFNYAFAEGDAGSALKETNSIVITQKISKKYFGNTQALGKLLVFDEYSRPFVVSGVLKDLSPQSSLQFDILQTAASCPRIKYFNWSWIWLQMATYVKLKPNVPNDAISIKTLEAKFPAMIRVNAASAFRRVGQPFDEFIKKGGKWELHLQPIANMHLHSAGISTRFFAQSDIKYIYIFSAIAFFIILLACVNFMNLSTAQASKRAKEVGLRKVMGSLKSQLIRQFLTEAVLYSLLAAAVAVVLVVILLPAFNQLAGKQLNIDVFFKQHIWLYLMLLSIVTGLLAGSYPAFYLTSFNPVTVLKGNGFLKSNIGAVLIRNGMVVFQFSVSTALIVCTIVVYNQLKYSQTRDLGLAKENVVIIPNTDRLGNSREALRQQFSSMPQVEYATLSTSVPSKGTFGDYYVPEVGDAGEHTVKNIALSSFMVDEYFVPALKFKMLKGRNFSRDYNDSTSVILNEAAAKQIGWKNALGKYITYPGNQDQRFKVIGIVKDFNVSSLHDTISAFALFNQSSKTYRANTSYISVRIKPGNIDQTLNQLQNKWKAFLPDVPFDYSFLDSEFDALYRADQQMGALFTVFTSLSIFVACLGLFGLAAYTAERRTKELGIRKVLGASVSGVVAMLSADFVRLVLISTLFAFPVAWYAMNIWLRDFAYRAPISIWVFALAGAMAILIAVITVSFQSVKAAIANPVKSLRSE
jgi:putative ABC transport system permease protein